MTRSPSSAWETGVARRTRRRSFPKAPQRSPSSDNPVPQGLDATCEGSLMVIEDSHSAMPRDLLLVRHGRSEGNLVQAADSEGNPSLRTPEFLARPAADWRLTKKGRDQATATGRWVRTWLGEVGLEG